MAVYELLAEFAADKVEISILCWDPVAKLCIFIFIFGIANDFLYILNGLTWQFRLGCSVVTFSVLF